METDVPWKKKKGGLVWPPTVFPIDKYNRIRDCN